MSFENKVVLVTGAGSGMGEATAILFAKEGADVVIVDCNEDTAINTAEKCKEYGNKALAIKTDLTKDDEVNNAIKITINNFGKLDILVNNAGTYSLDNLVSGRIMDSYDKIVNTNLRAVVLMTSLATRYLIETKGCIVNTSSIITKTSIRQGSNNPAYTVSKTGVDCFTRLSALELGPLGVRINAISPGPVRTNIFINSGVPRSFDSSKSSTALGKCSDPKEIADLILYLASDKAKSITGGIYSIDNGMCLM